MSRPWVVFLLVAVSLLIVLGSQASAATRPGDANGDGMVDMADYVIWFNNYAKTGATLATGDFDGSGLVDMNDYAIWYNNYAAGGGESKMCNIKIVTDSSPDYTDMPSLVRSITDNWATTHEKCWAMFYWNHIARRQTNPMKLHGYELLDPIRQFNDFGYTMCSTISGINSTIFTYMGLPIRYWEIGNHTVMEVMYEDGRYHMHDNSLSAMYTKCDGTGVDPKRYFGPSTGSLVTCGVADVSVDGSCPRSGNVLTPHHNARYHCVFGTSPDGFLEGADTSRTLASEGNSFDSGAIHYQSQYLDQDWGHRYVLNLRQHETYVRYSHTMGDTKDYYQPDPPPDGPDPEAKNYRYHIRGNGQWVFTPPLNAVGMTSDAVSTTGMQIMASGTGLQPAQVNQAGEIVYKIEGANVITSIKIEGTFKRATSGDVNAVDISVNNGLTWTNVWTNSTTGTAIQTINVCDPANGNYEALFKIRLLGQTAVTNAQLTTLKFTTITMINNKTQPKLRFGRNTVYVDKADQTGTVEIWPRLEGYNYRDYSVAESNIAAADVPANGSVGLSLPKVWAANTGQEAYIVFKVDTPGPMSKLVYGGRLYNRGAGAHIDFLHSFDNGATWTQDYTMTDTSAPWDLIHYETITNIPLRTKSALVKYRWNSQAASQNDCGLYATRMEANYWPGDSIARPLEVKYTWKERQTDYTTITRSHAQLVPSLPYSYVINVGGADHPVMESLQVNVQGAAGAVTYGYSDGIDVGGTKFQDRWVTLGNILSAGKPYVSTAVSRTNWGANDTGGVRLTDNVVPSNYGGGGTYAYGPLWQQVDAPKTTIDLGSAKTCGAYRIHTSGYPQWDAMKGAWQDIVEVQTSTDNVNFAHAGTFNFNLRWKDLPANYMWNDDETFTAFNFELITTPVTARYVKFIMTPWKGAQTRSMSVCELQVLDNITYTPFDLKLAPPPAFPGGGAGGGSSPGVSSPVVKKPVNKPPAGPSRSVTPVLIRKKAK